MAAARPTRPIALVGMPGAGKSAVGRILAARLAIPFVDTDEMVNAEAGRTIEELFFSEGQEAFRECERQVIETLLGQGAKPLPGEGRGPATQDACGSTLAAPGPAPGRRLSPGSSYSPVIATGGGAMAGAQTRELLLAHTVTVWLAASPKTLARRLASAPPRPLLKGENLEQELRRLLADRQEAYAQAELSLATDALSPAQTAETLAQMLSRAEPR